MEELQQERKIPPWGNPGPNDFAMAAPSVFGKFLHRADHSRPQGTPMEVPDGFERARLPPGGGADPAAEFLPALAVRENTPFLDPPRVDVVECAGEIDPWSSCHAAGRCTDHSRKKIKNVTFLL